MTHTQKTAALAAALLTLLTLLPACQSGQPTSPTQLASTLRLATTTSCENSGLLDHILPLFEATTGIHVDVMSVGSGRAMRLGENGDVDVLFVHSPDAEREFMDQGFGVNRRSVMYNEFVIVGPPSDPIGIRDMPNLREVMLRFVRTGNRFISRGDDSGTHAKELSLWRAAGIRIQPGERYIETGQGMAATLRVAAEMEGYTLTDIATFLTYADELGLEIVFEGDELLRNPYHVIAVNPQRHPHVKYLEAMLFIAWLTSPEGIEQIGAFTHGDRQLFTPDP